MSQRPVGKRPFTEDHGRHVINTPALGSRLKEAGCREERGMRVLTDHLLRAHFFRTRCKM